MNTTGTLKELTDKLSLSLQQPLPGRTAQLSLHTEKGLMDYEKMMQAADLNASRQSSVLILLYEEDGQVFFPLIKRPEYEGVHSGQMGLPGGKMEPEDKDIIETALRETYEEIGIAGDNIKILGTLTSLFIPPSRFWVNVVVGYCEGKPSFKPDPREVAVLIPIPINQLVNGIPVEERPVKGSSTLKMKAPGYVFEEYFIWGATSMILSEFRALINQS